MASDAFGSAAGKVAHVRGRLLELIDHGDEGVALPSERQLAHDWGVARMTLRRALDDLATAGFVVREHGRGNFVARPKLTRRLAMTSFSQEMRNRGLVPGSVTLEFRRLPAGPRQARTLRIPVNTSIVRFTRLRTADGDPIGLETTWVADDVVPGLAPADLDGSWYDLLAGRYGIPILTGRTTIEPTLLDEQDATLLHTEPGRPAFRLDVVTFGANGRVVECGTDIFRGDRFQLTAELRPVPAPALRRRARRTA
jgi:GntR family transcriptional regulator